MGIPERAKKALQAMKNIGFPPKEVSNVLKKLLEVYEQNYEYIEENSYQVLIDAVLEQQELKAAGVKTVVEDDPEPRKRLRKLSERSPSSSALCSDGPSEPLLKIPKLEADASPEPQSTEVNKRTLSEPDDSTLPSLSGDSTAKALPGPSVGEKTTGIMTQATSHREKASDGVPQTSPSSSKPDHAKVYLRETRAAASSRRRASVQGNPDSNSLITLSRDNLPAGERSTNMICYKEPKIEPGIELPSVTIGPHMPTDKESEDDIQHSLGFEVPIAMICPPDNSNPAEIGGASESLAAESADKGKGKESTSVTALDKGKTSDIVTSQEASSSNVDVVSSDTGEVKLKFCFNSDRRMPSLDAIFKLVEERCLKSYKILQPDFSLMKVMKEMCECALELSTETSDDQQENIVKITPLSDSLKKSGAFFSAQSRSDGLPCSSNGHVGCSAKENDVNGHREIDKLAKGKINRAPEDANSDSLAVIPQPQIALGDLRPLHDPNDITKGEERVRISLINEISNEKYPSSFHYIARNIVYQNAYVNFSLARIGDEDCCADCFGDCVAAAVPCACARATGGDFAYTLDGLVKDAFLDECISISHDTQNYPHKYCKVCPIERSKKEATPDPCKGHLGRKFIKECWSKCGCNMQCGNRVVQRGITCNLQVFYTPEGKGWGVRTLDELPKGAFVCEYVGEILTNMELYNRAMQSAVNAKHIHPVILDADWGSDGVLKDEESLCLDATFYGNVARFVNHRCLDANLVEIPIEVETPDHHYYHVAFFTTRKIQAYEELTWDYKINFDDPGRPVKAFRCRCGSKYCRDMRRSRTRSKALVIR